MAKTANFKAKITDKIGLHARPASLLVQASSKFKSDLKIEAAGKSANLKSIMSVMALAIKHGQEVVIHASGADAEEAIATIKKVMHDSKLI